MIIKNFLESSCIYKESHNGNGVLKNVTLFNNDDFCTKLKFIIYTEIEPGNSIGHHSHGDDEEAYIVLEGSGTVTVNGAKSPVKKGDVIINKPNWSHSLKNDSHEILKLLIFAVDK